MMRILSRPNDQYKFIKDNYMHSIVQQNLDHIFCSLRDIEIEYQRKEKTPPAGSATFAEAVRVEVEKQTVAAAELLWIQRGKDSSRPAGGRPANSSTTCYYCTGKGHFQRDCKHFKSQCQFCKRTSHLEIACRQKRQGSGGGGFGGGGGSGSGGGFAGGGATGGGEGCRERQKYD